MTNSMSIPLKKIITVDFDGTICEEVYPECGTPKKGVKRYLNYLRKKGFSIWIYSCRSNKKIRHIGEKKMKQYLKKEKIPYDKIIADSDGKPLVDYYIDDRAITYNDIKGWKGVVKELLKQYDRGKV